MDDDLRHNRHDVNDVDRLGVQSLLVNDAVHLVCGLGVSGGLIVARQQRSGALLLPNHRWGTVGRPADKTGGEDPGSIAPHTEALLDTHRL